MAFSGGLWSCLEGQSRGLSTCPKVCLSGRPLEVETGCCCRAPARPLLLGPPGCCFPLTCLRGQGSPHPSLGSPEAWPMSSWARRRRKFVDGLRGARGAPQILLQPGPASTCVSEATPASCTPRATPPSSGQEDSYRRGASPPSAHQCFSVLSLKCITALGDFSSPPGDVLLGCHRLRDGALLQESVEATGDLLRCQEF